jgi:hypothetical protein
VPISYQGRTFAMQSWLKNGAAIVPLLLAGAAATRFGVQGVLIVSPILLVVLADSLVVLSIRLAGLAPPSHLQVMESFWDEAGDAVVPGGERE